MSETTKAILIEYGGAVGIFVGGIILIKILLMIEKKALEKSSLDESLYTFILNGSRVILWVVLIVTLLGQLKVPTTPLVTVLGASGAAVALALKDSLGNIAGGIIILINKPFSKDDTIEVNGTTGVVDHIDLLTTQLHTFDNKIVTVPNGIVTNAIVINYSKQDKRRVDCQFGISYNADIAKAKEILLEITYQNPDILANPKPVIGVASQGDNAVIIDLRVWCLTEHYYDVQYFLQENVKIAFDEANINIPYPQMDIHMVK